MRVIVGDEGFEGSTSSMMPSIDRLSPREREVLCLMAQGRSNAAMAQELFLNPKTVESHVASIFTRLDLLPEPEHHRRVLAVLTFCTPGSGAQVWGAIRDNPDDAHPSHP